MTDSDGGYGKPPMHSRFKPGVSGNPKGRPPRKLLEAAAIIETVLNEKADYQERGTIKSASRWELSVRALVARAIKGDVKAADMLLDLRAHMERHGEKRTQRIYVSDWLPDYPGQTAEQKTREAAMQATATPVGWWEDPNHEPTKPGD